MDNQPELSDPHQTQDKEQMNKKFLEPINLGAAAYEAATNLKWDSVEKLIPQALEKARDLEGNMGEVVRGMTIAMTTTVEGLVLQFRDTGPERFKQAAQNFEQALEHLQELKNKYPEELAEANINIMLTSMELQAIMAALNVAEEQKNSQKVLILEARRKSLIDQIPPEYRDFMNNMNAFLLFQEIMKQVKESQGALVNMDLTRALRIINGILEKESDILTSIKKAPLSGVIFQTTEAMVIGAFEYVKGFKEYIRVLHDAVVGDVTREDVNQLTRCEDLMRSGSKKMLRGMMILNKFSEQEAKAFSSSQEYPITLIRNLRNLCRESLKPKSWLASASFKFIIVFLCTVAVLMAVVSLTKPIQGLSGEIFVGYVVLVSFISALIGGFGFEGLRFLPFAELLSRARPKAAKPSKEKTAS